jgi:hypothetical protein
MWWTDVDSGAEGRVEEEPGIDCERLPCESMFVTLPRKVDTILPRRAERTLPRANLAIEELNRSGSLSRSKRISVCCAHSVETVWELKMLDTNTVNKRVCRAWTAARGSRAQSISSLISQHFFFQWCIPVDSGPRPLLQFPNHVSQTAGLLGRVISPSQGVYLNTGQH